MNKSLAVKSKSNEGVILSVKALDFAYDAKIHQDYTNSYDGTILKFLQIQGVKNKKETNFCSDIRR